ncbi:MAG: CBS domain-containing protein [Spirochaetota bacterium]|jgi:tRNA nucleotidyltransferase (CCA-adding enzyme)|nr:CBS domain-containing protein [Spirochaetota bacterium]
MLTFERIEKNAPADALGQIKYKAAPGTLSARDTDTHEKAQGITIIVGHKNSDLDCFGSMALARYLYPNTVLIRSSLIHPVARNLLHLFNYRLGLVSIDELNPNDVRRIVVVDTRTLARIDEYFSNLEDFGGELIVYDHHDSYDKSIPATRYVQKTVGANTSLLAWELMSRGIKPNEDDATIALTGIYADTGNFTHDTVTEEDFLAAAWLRSCGAAVELVRTFLKPLSDKYQITLFHELLNKIVYREIRGHSIVFVTMELPRQQSGLAAIVEKIHEVEDHDATFAVFGLKRENAVLIVGRSLRETVPVDAILGAFGGGGHTCAASAYIKKANAGEITKVLQSRLYEDLAPSSSAQDILFEQENFISGGWSLMDASKFLEQINASGSAVVGEDGLLAGVLTLRDIQKGRKHNQMHAPVSAYMTRNVVSVTRDMGIRKIEGIIKERNIGHLPVVENGRVVGMITREHILEFKREQSSRERIIAENVRAALFQYKDSKYDDESSVAAPAQLGEEQAG